MESFLKKSAGHDRFLLSFFPEQWDAVKVLSAFPLEGVENERLFKRGLNSVGDHFEKYRAFAGLANKLISGFEVDRKQVEIDGYSPAIHSKEFAAVAESCVCELYSTLDGVRDVIFVIYNNIRGIQKKSNEKLYRRASSGEYGDNFPSTLNEILTRAYTDWFRNLRGFRTEMVHGSLGSTTMDHDTKKIRYFHQGMRGNGTSLIMEDFVEFISKLYSQVLNHLNEIFSFLYNTLNLQSTLVMCGIYKGRIYERLIEPERPLTNDAGYCVARQWFDNMPEFKCPLSGGCKAYKNAITQL